MTWWWPFLDTFKISSSIEIGDRGTNPSVKFQHSTIPVSSPVQPTISSSSLIASILQTIFDAVNSWNGSPSLVNIWISQLSKATTMYFGLVNNLVTTAVVDNLCTSVVPKGVSENFKNSWKVYRSSSVMIYNKWWSRRSRQGIFHCYCPMQMPQAYPPLIKRCYIAHSVSLSVTSNCLEIYSLATS